MTTSRSASPATVVRFSSPADIITTIPYLFGFMPSESVVVVELRGPRKRLGPMLRYDIVRDDPAGDAPLDDESTDAPDDRSVASVLTVARRDRWRRVLVVAYTADPDECGAGVLRLLRALDAAGIEVEDAFCATAARWWCVTCPDEVCCPPEGRPLDPTATTGAAESVLAGMTVAPSRESLRSRFEPAADEARAAVADALASRDTVPRVEDPAAGERDLTRIVRGHLGASDRLRAADVATLIDLVQDVLVRDQAIAQISHEQAPAFADLWLHVARLTPSAQLPNVACVVAFGCWLAGRGVLAGMAVELALEIEPTCRLALLMAEMLATMVSPAIWPADQLSRPAPGVLSEAT